MTRLRLCPYGFVQSSTSTTPCTGGRECYVHAYDAAMGYDEPSREPSAEQERAWDEQHDGTSLGS